MKAGTRTGGGEPGHGVRTAGFSFLEVVAALLVAALLCGVVASGLTGAFLQDRTAGHLAEAADLVGGAEAAWWRHTSGSDEEMERLRRDGWDVRLEEERPRAGAGPGWERWTFRPGGGSALRVRLSLPLPEGRSRE